MHHNQSQQAYRHRRRETAVILVPDGFTPDALAECGAHVKRRGYTFDGVVVGVTPEHWAELRRRTLADEIQVVVVPSMGILPRDRPGRIESLTQEIHPPASHHQQRPRWTR